MMRARGSSKQPASDLLAATAVEEITEEGAQSLANGVKKPAKSTARGKKTPAATNADEANNVPQAVEEKKSAVRNRRKPVNKVDDVVEEEPEPAKPKGRGKKATVEVTAEKATKSRAKAAKTPVTDEPEEGKGRIKKEKTSLNDEPESAPKSRGRKKDLEVADATEPIKEPAAKEKKGRTKKDAIQNGTKSNGKKDESAAVDEPAAPAAAKRGRGTKRTAATSKNNEPEAEPEPEVDQQSEKVEIPAKKRVKKAEPQEKAPEDEAPTTSKKRAPKKATKKVEVETDVPATKPARGRKRPAVATEEEDDKNDKDHVETPAKKTIKEEPKANPEEEVAEAPAATTSKKRAPKKAIKKDDGELSVPETKPAARGRGKRAAADAVENADEIAVEDTDGSRTSKAKKAAPQKTEPYDQSLFTSPTDKSFNLKISSWNVAGLRAWLKKDGLKFVDCEKPDIFCLQETKCANDQLPDEMTSLPGYHPYWLCMPGGYAGVAIYSKIMPIHVEYGIGSKDFDDVGRMITAEYEKFYLINVYVPNSGRKLVNLEMRMRWEELFQTYVQKLDALKPVVICGDMNVSHLEIDLANPKTNTRNAGFTKEERDKMTELLGLGYVDTFRHLYPKTTGAYTFWTYMSNARARNVGWRLDYCIVSERFLPRVVDNVMRSQCPGSDHCPITIFLNL